MQVQLVSDLLLSHVIEGCSLASFPSGFHPPSLDPFSSIVPSVVPISEFIPRILWVWCVVEEKDQSWNEALHLSLFHKLRRQAKGAPASTQVSDTLE